MTGFTANGTPRGRRSSDAGKTGPRERTLSRHREESAERFANFGRNTTGIAFDNAFWQRVRSKSAHSSGGPGSKSPPHREDTMPGQRHVFPTSDSDHYAEGDRWQQQADDLTPTDREDQILLDMELEARRRRVESLVEQWADDSPARQAPSRQRRHSKRSKSSSVPKPHAGMGQLEKQVADLRKRQAEQAHLLLAQEEKQRQKEEQTKQLLQQQAQALAQEAAEELRSRRILEELRAEQEREEEERRWQEQMEQEEQRRQEELRMQEELRRQEIEEERLRQQRKFEEWRRQEMEREQRIRQEIELEEIRRQEMINEQEIRRREAELEEKRRQKFIREREEEERRQQQQEELRRQQEIEEEELRAEQEREEEERRWQQQMDQEEQRRQEELRMHEEMRRQDIEEEIARQMKFEEWRRQELDREQRNRQEAVLEEMRRQEIINEHEKRRRSREAEQEKRRQRLIREREEEDRRQQQQEDLRRKHEVEEDFDQPQTFWDFEDEAQRRFSEEYISDSNPRSEHMASPDRKHRNSDQDWTRDSTCTGSDTGDPKQKSEVPCRTSEAGCTDSKRESKNNFETPDQNRTEDQPAEAENNLKASSLYDILQVGRDATMEDIRKAYKRQCMKHHPDKGGTRERFEEVGNAYQILSDKSLRKAYDQRGMDGVEYIRAKEKSTSQANSAGQQEKVMEKAQAIVVEAYVPLEVAHTGGSVDVQVVRIAACAACGGNGTAPGACYIQCPSCDGQGGVPQYVQFGHMIVEQRAQCTVCAGQGMVLPASALCCACGGEQLVEEEVRVPFEIPPGIAEKERLVAKAQGHTMPGLATGDVKLVCRMQDHHRFLRKGDDLLAEHRVPLQVAICGGAFEVPLLNGHSVRVRLPRGCILQPGSIKCVPGEGMPKRQNPHLRGDLVLRFDIDFPESVSEDVAARLADAFAGIDAPERAVGSPAKEQRRPPPTPDRQDGEVYLSDFDMEQFGKTLHQESKEAYIDDDDEERARAAAAAQAAQAYRGYGRSRPGHYDFSGFVPPGSAGSVPCRQM